MPAYRDAALKAYVLGLDRGIEILQGCYSKDFGRPADFDPADMLRSLVLMVTEKEQKAKECEERTEIA